MSAGEDDEPGSGNPLCNPPQVHGRYHRITTAGRGQRRRADAGQLAVVSIAAKPGAFGCDLGPAGTGKDTFSIDVTGPNLTYSKAGTLVTGDIRRH